MRAACAVDEFLDKRFDGLGLACIIESVSIIPFFFLHPIGDVIEFDFTLNGFRGFPLVTSLDGVGRDGVVGGW
eukprot:CAMPEP_0185772488 /NCGR_PEP_ID=MMETSP1174-20130828/69342_1 /TAXON_ID=35687 /ORGANISM="Dictyocha speculum, Strain CCMP1381" /LENGTH=72 /DNA_ID=CAMNT_0028458801 /DNA_START=128 /DNA_END=349 /DNA_ORIENTATION=+